MPLAPRAICARCRKGTGCECRKEARKERQQQLDERRGSRHERGYSNDWTAFSDAYKRENPLCEDCINKGLVTPVHEVHHIKKLRDFPELKFEPANLRGLCKSCHSKRTIRGE